MVSDRPSHCSCCGRNLKNIKASGISKRQEVNIILKREVTEYQVETVTCSCGKENTGRFPEDITKSIQYGATVKAFVCYCLFFQLLPYARLALLLKNFGIYLSQRSLFNFAEEAFLKLEFWQEAAKEALFSSKAINVDETGITVDKKRMWLHTYSGPAITLLFAHPNRGRKAFDEIGILPNYKWNVVHDGLGSYVTDSYKYTNALCGSHLLRDLNACIEFDKQKWAEKMKRLLLKINGLVNKSKRNVLSQKKAKYYRRQYRKILKEAERECPQAIKIKGIRGKTKKPRPQNLLERLIRHQKAVLLFMTVPHVPFTNNLAERNLRMAKVQQKISGCFRSMRGAEFFARIRSYIMTSMCENKDPLDALKELFSR